jgi:plasmid stability protein
MKSLTIKNIPDDLHAALKRRAELNYRSLNREIISILERLVMMDAAQVERLGGSAMVECAPVRSDFEA